MKFVLLCLLSYSAMADVALDDAYKREKAFLTAQKEALLKMKVSLQKSQLQRKAQAENDINKKQTELSQLQLKNQELHEEFKALEKMTKESSQMAGQLEKNNLRINENLLAVKAKLGLPDSASTETDVIRKFEATLEDVLNVISVLGSGNWRGHAFLDENEHLVKGEVLFQGLFSAWGKHGNKIYSLAPYNKEFLKVVNASEGKDMYIFTPYFEKTGLKVAKSWKESVADAVPAVVMMVIMVAVLGLFILLARA